MDIFPSILVRIAGGSFDHLDKLNSRDLNEISSILLELSAKNELKKDAICLKILDLIRCTDNTRKQNLLQNFRRDLFNDRKIKSETLNLIFESVPPDLKHNIENFLLEINDFIRFKENAINLYKTIRDSNRLAVQQISREDLLNKGLILASHSLFERLPKYRDKKIVDFKKRDFNIENSLLKFITRMNAKTSPFSTFNNLFLGDIVVECKEIIKINQLENNSIGVSSYIRINNHLLKYLQDVLRHYRAFYLYLPIRLNPTISLSDTDYRYLINSNNIEVFQKISISHAVSQIFALLESKVEEFYFVDLIDEVENYIDASKDEIEKFIKNLIDLGFLEYDWKISGVDPDWDIKLVSRLCDLQVINVDLIPELIGLLKELRKYSLDYAVADVNLRVQILQKVYFAFKEICIGLHEKAGLPLDERLHAGDSKAFYDLVVEKAKDSVDTSNQNIVFKNSSSTFFYFTKEMIFYEDTIKDVSASFDKKELTKVIKVLDELVQSLSPFEFNYAERERMKSFYKDRYLKNRGVSVLEFYENYFREVKKPRAEKDRISKKNDTDEAMKISNQAQEIISVKERAEFYKVWGTDLKAKIVTRADSTLGYSTIQLLNSDFKTLPPVNAPQKGNSFGAFIQFYIDNSDNKPKLKGVVNSLFPGFGKMISRFLHTLDPSITGEICKWNELLIKDGEMFLENCDASYFNANIHPTLMPYEVKIPGGHNNLKEKEQLSINEFEIHIDNSTDQLYVKHSTSNSKSFFFDLGFQGQNGRSQLYQLLDKFSKVDYVSLDPLFRAVNSYSAKASIEKPRINIFPRIVLEDCLILQRKRWEVSVEEFPMRLPLDTDEGYFFTLNEWRKKNNIDEEVFVNINGLGKPSINNEEKNLGRDDRKPQYINFSNPLLVNLFEKLLSKNPSVVKIEEMIPNSSQLLTLSNGDRYVTEMLVQWYNYE